jgi:hypothetical protein
MDTLITVLAWMLLVWAIVEVVVSAIKALRGQTQDTWKGGNGCNWFNAPDREACCTEHDREYKAGGWYLSRLGADWRVFKCSWKEGAKIYPFLYFIGSRLGGMFTFQWGKKRHVDYPTVESKEENA